LHLLEQESLGSLTEKPVCCRALLYQVIRTLEPCVPKACEAADTSAASSAQEAVEQLCSELRARLDHPWTQGEISRRGGYSARQLTRLFREVVGVPPCCWLREERVRAAAEQLVATDDSMANIAAHVGFGGRRQLGRAFLEISGLTPMQYRALHRERAKMAGFVPPMAGTVPPGKHASPIMP
jgi:transcriptional regulator GlxA family with amidase domain